MVVVLLLVFYIPPPRLISHIDVPHRPIWLANQLTHITHRCRVCAIRILYSMIYTGIRYCSIYRRLEDTGHDSGPSSGMGPEGRTCGSADDSDQLQAWTEADDCSHVPLFSGT